MHLSISCLALTKSISIRAKRMPQTGRLLAVVAVTLLAACSTPGPSGAGLSIPINTDIVSTAQDSRVKIVVLHYTAANKQRSLDLLSGPSVSSHYLITDENPPQLYQLVDENRRAWHAGVSEWYGRPHVNDVSIGIEIVNAGGSPGNWASYSPEQIQLLIDLLRDIVERHEIKPENIVGHSDIAPQRKLDPGPRFPWVQLAQAGLGRWPEPTLSAHFQAQFEADGLPDVQWVQERLEQLGYPIEKTGQWDQQSQNVLAAFPMHYRPARSAWQLDAETAGLLKALGYD